MLLYVSEEGKIALEPNYLFEFYYLDIVRVACSDNFSVSIL